MNYSLCFPGASWRSEDRLSCDRLYTYKEQSAQTLRAHDRHSRVRKYRYCIMVPECLCRWVTKSIVACSQCLLAPIDSCNGCSSRSPAGFMLVCLLRIFFQPLFVTTIVCYEYCVYIHLLLSAGSGLVSPCPGLWGISLFNCRACLGTTS